jgi:hypothetical protein
MSFRASAVEVMGALEEAARRTGMQHLSADPANGIVVFTAGKMALTFGEKVTARIREITPGTVQVTLSSNRPFGLTRWGRNATGRDQMADALGQLLQPAG